MCTHATKAMLPELSVLLYGVCTGEKGYNKLEYCQVVMYYFTASWNTDTVTSHTKSYVFNNLHSIWWMFV